MPDVLSILNWVFIGIPAVIIVLNALMGMKRGFALSISKLIRVVISIAIAAFITRFIIGFLSAGNYTDQLIIFLEQYIGNNEVLASLGDLEVVVRYAAIIISALLGPLVFLIVYLLITLILLIPFAIINALIKKAGKKVVYDDDGDRRRKKVKTRKMPLSWLFGLVISAVCGVLIAGAVMTPFVGYVYNVSVYYEKLEESGVITPSEEGEEIANILREAKDLQSIQFINQYSSPAFDYLTTYTSDGGEEVSVFVDVDVIIDIIPDIMDMSQNFGEEEIDFSSLDLSAMRNITAKLNNAGQIKYVIVTAISDAAKKWSAGETVLGLNLSEKFPDWFDDRLTEIFLRPFAEMSAENAEAVTASFAVIDDLSYGISDVGRIIDKIQAMDFEAEFDSLDLSGFNDIADIIGETRSSVMKRTLVEVFNLAGETWHGGDEFMRINLSEVAGSFSNYFTSVYDLFRTTTVETLGDDLKLFAGAVEVVGDVATQFNGLTAMDFSNISALDTTPIHNIVSIIGEANNHLVNDIVASLLSDAGTKWLAGEEFMGLNIKSSLPAEYADALDSALELLANTTDETLVDNLNTFASAIESIKNTYIYVQSLTTAGATLEDMQSNLEDIFNSLTPEAAEIVSSAITGDMLTGLGLDSDTADTVADLVSGVIEGVAELTPEQKAAEAAAMNNIMTYVTSGSAESATPSEIISTVLDSSIISEQIINVAEEAGASFGVGAAQSEAINNAIAAYEADHLGEMSDQQQAVLDAIRSMFSHTAP